MPTARRLALLAAPALLAGCLYDYRNPAELLQAGQATGRVLADPDGTGALEPFPGVSVSLKGAVFDQTTHESGRFALLELPPGRHTLLFRKGTAWSLDRDVELGFGADGQPEGVDLGVVVLRYAAAVEGTFSIPPGNALSGGVVVDERTGQTAALVVSAFPDTWKATFRFPALGVGTHLLKAGATDTLGGRWVGGPATVTISQGDQGKAIPVADGVLAGRAASALGRIRFRVQQVGRTTADLSLVRAFLSSGALTVGPLTPDSQGFVDAEVPEGVYQVSLSGGGLAAAPLEGPATRLLATVPGSPLGPPRATAVVMSGRVAEVGGVYVVSDVVTFASRSACVGAGDCGQHPCVAGSCGDYVAPGSGSAGASLSFCAPCTFNGSPGAGPPCVGPTGQRGLCVCPISDPTGQLCPSLPPTPSACDPGCGTLCTTDGRAVLGTLPGPTGCILP